MKQAKPLLTIKQKCRECSGRGCFSTAIIGTDDFTSSDCHKCSGTGQQETKIYSLRDFEKCKVVGCVEGRVLGKYGREVIHHKKCNGTGYIIPKEYEPYEIKTAQEFDNYVKNEFSLVQAEKWYKVAHNLKE